MNDAPVGILDSDIGGLSVVHEFRRLCPSEDIVYFADTAHYPYGTKTPEEIFRRFEEASHFFSERGVKAILCACSTASAVAVPYFHNRLSIPLIGMLNRELVDNTLHNLPDNKTVGLIATRLTVQSRAFERLFQAEAPAHPVSFHSQVATELVNAVTEGDFSQTKIAPLLNDIFKTFPSDLGALIIGCTHFYHLREPIKARISPVPLVEPSQVASLCLQQKLENSRQTHSAGHLGKTLCWVSGDMTAFEQRVRKLEKTQGTRYVDTFLREA